MDLTLIRPEDRKRNVLFLALLALLPFPALVLAEADQTPVVPSVIPTEPVATDSPKLLRDPVAASTAAASAPRPEPKPKVLPPAEILDCVEYTLPGEGRSIFVQKVAPPPGYVAPPAHRPAPSPPAAPSESFLARTRASQAEKPEMRYLRFSATVYPRGPEKNGDKATLVRWSHRGQNYQAWSSLDWNHFRGLDRFDSADGKKLYWLMMGIGDMTEWRQRRGQVVPPDFQAGEIAFRIVEGDSSNKEALADLETLHDLYRSDGQRLKLAYEIREKANRERQAWLEANPPKPEDIIVRHWKVPDQAAPDTATKREEQP